MSTQESGTQDPVLRSPQAKASSLRKPMVRIGKEALVLSVIGIVFVVPFIFIVLTAAKTRQEAALLQFLSLIHISEPTRPY